MTPEEIKASIAKQVREGIGLFGSIVTATEVILGSEYLIERSGQSGRDSAYYTTQPVSAAQSEGKAQSEITQIQAKQIAKAFHTARHQYNLFTKHFAHKLQSDAVRNALLLPIKLTPQSERLSVEDLTTMPVKLIGELFGRADAAQRTFDQFLLSSSTPPEFLSPFPDNSGSSETNMPNGGAGSESSTPGPTPPEESGGTPSSFDEYSQPIQEEAKTFYETGVEPEAKSIIDNALSTISGGGQISFDEVSRAVAGVAAAGALSIGGPVGAALAALAWILIPRMLAAVEKALVEAALESGGI